MTDNINDRQFKKLVRRYAIEMTRLQAVPHIDIELHPLGALAIIISIQLACRHPENNGWTREQSEFLERQLMEMFPPHTAIRQVLDMGWESQFDVSVAGVVGEEIPWEEVPEDLRKQGSQVTRDMAEQLKEALKRMGLGEIEVIPVERQNDSN